MRGDAMSDRHRHPVAAWPGRCLSCGLLLLALARPAAAQPAPAAASVVRIGISSRNLGAVNRTDLKAALKVWLMSVTRDRNLNVDPYPVVMDSVGEMVDALRQKQVDVITTATDEFLEIEKAVPLNNMFSSQIGGRVTEQYVLLVRGDRGPQKLSELSGQSLVVLDSPRNALAPLWLDAELWRHHFPASTRLFGKVTHTSKLNLAILPVFFGQAGAALVNRRGFETAVELNPQLAKGLRILAGSQELLPSLTAYRTDGSPVVVQNYQKEAGRLAENASGRLILNLFQIDGIVEVKPSDLAPTRAFLHEYQRLKAECEPAGGVR
jgi:ABC-type phosphate/phosphonate transport system substrate-binding protein